MITDVWMTLDSLNRISILIELKAFRTKRYTLIYLDMVTYCAGFSYYDTGAVIYEEIIPDCCTWVNVYSRLLMSILRHYSGEQRNLQLVKNVGEPISAYRLVGWISNHDFFF